MYLVVDNAFNRYNYPSLIGKRFETPPAYASVRKLTEQEIDELEMILTAEMGV